MNSKDKRKQINIRLRYPDNYRERRTKRDYGGRSLNNSTTQQLNDSTTQQFNNSTIQRLNNSTIQQLNNSNDQT